MTSLRMTLEGVTLGPGDEVTIRLAPEEAMHPDQRTLDDFMEADG